MIRPQRINRAGRCSVLLAILACSLLFSNGVSVSDALADRSVVDSLDRNMILPAKVDRIACMYAFTGHVVAMLGEAEKIVAVSNGLKRDVLLSEMFPSIGRAVVPKFQGAINIEELTGARPDVVFVQAQTGRNKALTDKLDAVGLLWVAVDFHTMAEQREVVALIGKVIGAEAKAEQYINYYLRCIGRVASVLNTIGSNARPRVYHSFVEPNRTSPIHSLPSDWLAAVGAINVAEQSPVGLSEENEYVGIEQILLWNPDVILANEPGVIESIRKDPKWAPIAAVKSNRLYQLPIGISRWGHPGSLETPLAVLWTAGVLYPEKFKKIDIAAEVKGFYRQFFNYELTEQVVNHILSGRGMRLNKNRK